MFFLGIAFLPLLLSSSSTSSLVNKAVSPSAFDPKSVEVAIREEKPKEQVLVCENCSANEKTTLTFLSTYGIKDKNAMATVMGNIRQESMFLPNICEGGARVSYHGCKRGGFGIVQWTSIGRYRGLGNFAYRYGGDPSSLDTQLRYMVKEPQWKRVEGAFMTPGRSIEYYMGHAHSWLGWGVHGKRTRYAYDYARKLKVAYV